MLEEILSLYGFSDSESHNLLLALELTDCQVHVDNNYSLQEELDSLNDSLQGCFLRAQGTERQQLNDKFKDEVLRASLIPLLAPFIDSIHTGDNITTKLLLGASEIGTKERLDILANLEKSGFHAENIYLLGGKRDLWIDYEPTATSMLAERLVEKEGISQLEAEGQIIEAIKEFFPDKNNINSKRAEIVKHFTVQGITWPTESDMMVKLSKNYEELTKSNIILVDAPMKINAKGDLTRPDTLDTFNQLWKDHGATISEAATNEVGSKFSMSIVTTQPYGAYQKQQALAAFHDKPVSVFVVAEGIKNTANMNIATVFDSFARTIYAGKNVVSLKILEINKERKKEL